MALEGINDKLSIKDLLFTKAIPNYAVPVDTNGYKNFPCKDCGDKFLFESSYNDHINRKSLKITFSCRYCLEVFICNNRCRFLSHIRSHSFKTTTINVSDLKIEPLPLQDINMTLLPKPDTQIASPNPKQTRTCCFECKGVIDIIFSDIKDRALHYMRYTNMTYSCPICSYASPNTCSFSAHLRIHFGIPPYICPECGLLLSRKNILYPFDHYCKGFNAMREATRIKCNDINCNKMYHPNDYKIHLREHLKEQYKCVRCSTVWNKTPNKRHTNCKHNEKIVSYLECPLCATKLTNKSHIRNHLHFHYKRTINLEKSKVSVYPCFSCTLVFNEAPNLIHHQINEHSTYELKTLLLKFLSQYVQVNNKAEIYRVTKKCDKCLRSFIYRCEYQNIKILPNECPYKCYSNSSTTTVNDNTTIENAQIICFLCKQKISENWQDIKSHYSAFHHNHKCVDVKILLERIDKKMSLPNKKSDKCLSKVKKKTLNDNKLRITKINSKNNNQIVIDDTDFIDKTMKESISCNICDLKFQDKETLETHIIIHRDPCMAYQCLECGQCFVVKPSFSTHLLLAHGIDDITEYIRNKQCFNEFALLKQPNNSKEEDEPVKENQCKICRDQFENVADLEKHFRVHGMAFLMKNTNKNCSP